MCIENKSQLTRAIVWQQCQDTNGIKYKPSHLQKKNEWKNTSKERCEKEIKRWKEYDMKKNAF